MASASGSNLENSKGLAALLSKAVIDQGVRDLMFDDPTLVGKQHQLSSDEVERLSQITRQDFDTALGKFLTYKLLPTSLGERFLILPLHGNGFTATTERSVIRLDQTRTGANIGERGTSKNRGQVFGSGTHPTTRLCVELMERYLNSGARVLDLGTGSGILALFAARLGAREVVGLDVDTLAVAIAEENARHNKLEQQIHFELGDASWLGTTSAKPFNLIVSNILLRVHKQSLALGILDYLVPGGTMILSGMHRKEIEELAAILERHSCSVIEQIYSGKWWAIAVKLA